MCKLWRHDRSKREKKRTKTDSMRELHSERLKCPELKADADFRVARWRGEVRDERDESQQCDTNSQTDQKETAASAAVSHDRHQMHHLQWKRLHDRDHRKCAPTDHHHRHPSHLAHAQHRQPAAAASAKYKSQQHDECRSNYSELVAITKDSAYTSHSSESITASITAAARHPSCGAASCAASESRRESSVRVRFHACTNLFALQPFHFILSFLAEVTNHFPATSAVESFHATRRSGRIRSFTRVRRITSVISARHRSPRRCISRIT